MQFTNIKKSNNLKRSCLYIKVDVLSKPPLKVGPTFGKATLRNARICGTSACRKIMILATQV